MNAFQIPDDHLILLVLQNRVWGPVKVPESLQKGLTNEQERDLKIILEDRRVTDLSAQYWMKLRIDNETLRTDETGETPDRRAPSGASQEVCETQSPGASGAPEGRP